MAKKDKAEDRKLEDQKPDDQKPDDQKPEDQKPDDQKPEDRKPSELVEVSVKQAIAFDGLVIRPGIAQPNRSKPPIITPVKAVIPRTLAESFGDNYVEIIGDADNGEKIGVIAKPAGK